MSLFGALQLGGSALAAQQTALQVAGNNIANAGTAGYTREATNLVAAPDVQSSSGVAVGSGVGVASVQRQVSQALNESLRESTSDQSAADTLNTQLTQLQTTFGALDDNDLASQLSSFFNGFSTLANDPTDSGQAAVVIQNGQSLAQSVQALQSQVGTQLENTQSQIGADVQQANTLATQIASLNGQIASLGGGSATNSLMDQRDQALSQLSGLMNIRVVDQTNGSMNVLVNGVPLVNGTASRGVSSKLVPDAAGTSSTIQLTFADNGDQMTVSGGTIGGLEDTSDNYLTPAMNTINTLAAGLISAVNDISTQGQGASGFSTVTGTTQVLDPTLPLNASASTTGIAFPPSNGSFSLYLTDSSTGQTTTQQINVNLSGQGTQTTLNSLAASITAAGGGDVSASVNSSGQLTIASSNPNVTFGFGEDTSGTLAALGINTFFSGSNAGNIAVNPTLQNNPSLLATGRGNVSGSNQNAQALALAGAAAVSALGGQSLTDYYTGYIGDLATQAQSASNNSATQDALNATLTAQQQAISGVSTDQETINLMQYQRAFEGSANFITVINQMMQTVLGLTTAAT